MPFSHHTLTLSLHHFVKLKILTIFGYSSDLRIRLWKCLEVAAGSADICQRYM